MVGLPFHEQRENCTSEENDHEAQYWISERIRPRSKILEVGCGNSILPRLLREDGHFVVGGDIRLLRGIDIALNAANLPFPNDMFDLTIERAVLLDFSQLQGRNGENIVRELRRVTKPGGSIYSRFWRPEYRDCEVIIRVPDFYVFMRP